MSMLAFSQNPKVLLVWDGRSFQRHPKEEKPHTDMAEYSLSTNAVPSRQSDHVRTWNKKRGMCIWLITFQYLEYLFDLFFNFASTQTSNLECRLAVQMLCLKGLNEIKHK